MNVLMLNGSPHTTGNTIEALNLMKEVFTEHGIGVDVVHIGDKLVHGCVGCYKCKTAGKCVFDDVVNETAPMFERASALVIGSPVYFASANGTLISFLDRLFYSTHFDKSMKVGASVAVARRGGLSTTLDELNKYFGICSMPIATSTYWNGIHGRTPGEVLKDEEGKITLRTLARNMIFLMESITLGKEKFGLPAKEEKVMTNFIR